MMAGNPNWWSMINGMHPVESSDHHHQLSSSSSSSSDHYVFGASNSSNSSTTAADQDTIDHHPLNQDFPARSWSQLLLGGEDQDKYGASLFQQQKKLENWEDQVLLNLNPSFTRIINNSSVNVDHVKQEINPQSTISSHLNNYHEFHQPNIRPPNSSTWLPQHHQNISSPTSCITTLSNNFLNFSGAPPSEEKHHRRTQDRSSECNSTSTGGVSNKRARVQHSSAQPALKVRKEKLGDRITALHQIVSPFGKTDTASVLSEAIGYIRFLQGQIEALSSPYMRNASGSSATHHQHSDTQSQEGLKDLRSRGLCLVPISCTQNVENDNGADYWAPAALGGSGF